MSAIRARRHTLRSTLARTLVLIRTLVLKPELKRSTTYTLWNGRIGEIRPFVLWYLGSSFFEAFCNSGDSLVGVI